MSAYSLKQRPCRVRLNANELGYPLPEELHELLMETLRQVELHRYPDPEASELRETLARFYYLESSNILVGNGSDEFISLVLAAFAEPPARVLAPIPTFSVYHMAATILGHEALEVPLTKDWQLDAERMLDAVRRYRPAVTFLSSPNNPTGNLFDEAVMRAIVTESPGIVVLDEAYGVYGACTYLPWLDEYPNVLVMKTMSKVGLAGTRLGFLVGRREAVHEVNKVRPPYNVNAMTQAVVRLVLERYDLVAPLIAAVIEERRRLAAWLGKQPGVTAFPSDANFILFRVHADATRGDAAWLHEALMDREVLLRAFPGHPLLHDCLRVTIGQPQENAAFREALDALLASGREG